ncbi:MAG: proteasome ATPase [Actinomycetaceae bacterium]|nr:proteasome ATPase [Actinomycetaceae bacterium]
MEKESTSTPNNTRSNDPVFERLTELKDHCGVLTRKNTRLASALAAARQELATMHSEVERLNTPPLSYGTILKTDPMKRRADVWLGGRKVCAVIAESVVASNLKPGDQVRLNDHLVITEVAEDERCGDVVFVKEIIDKQTILAVVRQDEEQVLSLADTIVGTVSAGDAVVADMKARIALYVIQRAEVNELLLEEPPNVTYDDVGGLGPQIESIRDSIELPFLYPDLYRQYNLHPPRGVLLYGPPGCGKTLIAKAVANSLGKRASEAAATTSSDKNVDAVLQAAGAEQRRAYFLNIKGPQLLNKYVGETERQIRLIFGRARELAGQGIPVVIFFDEMDSLFRIRGTGKSSDVETTVVPQLLSEIDGVEALDNVVIIGASNREDMLDPAIVRPGRLDIKICIERPNKEGAKEIFALYLTPDLPIDSDTIAEYGGVEEAIEALIDQAAQDLFQKTDKTAMIDLTFASGRHATVYQADLVSGAMIANIVSRAKKMAIKDTISGQGGGLNPTYLSEAIRQERLENLDIPASQTPEEWARISGYRAEKVVALDIIQNQEDKQ